MKNNAGFMIGQIKQIQARIFEVLLKENGLSDFNGAQGRILYVLWQEDGLMMKEISYRTSLAKTTLTSMLGRMREKGFIHYEQSEKDNRQTLVFLTKKARDLFDEYQIVSQRMKDIFYRDLTDDEINILEDLLERIKNNLQKEEAKIHETLGK